MSEKREDFDPSLELMAMVSEFKPDYEKAKKGNVAAGQRARKVLQDIRKLCVELRVTIMQYRKEKIG